METRRRLSKHYAEFHGLSIPVWLVWSYDNGGFKAIIRLAEDLHG